MRNSILAGFLSLWIFSIVIPSAIAIVDKGEQSILVLSHKEEEKHETEKKDTVEEKIVTESSNGYTVSSFGENSTRLDWYVLNYSFHIEEIPLPPPEHLI